MAELREVDVYWTIQSGKRHSIALTENDAWESLESLYLHAENPHGWTVERSRETVPVSQGRIVEGEGEMIALTEDAVETHRQNYTSTHVFWSCPHCNQMHNVNLYDDPIERTAEAPNPSIWFCERGDGLVLVQW
jgi:hypothetical protein